MRGYWSKSLCSKGGSLSEQISGVMGRRPPTTVGIRKLKFLLRAITLRCLRDPMFSRFDTILACQTDRQTDGHTQDDSKYRASITSRG